MKYYCEICKEYFDTIEEYTDHEPKCNNKNENIIKIITETMSILQEKYNLTLSKNTVMYIPDEYSNHFYIDIQGCLPNGNKFHITTSNVNYNENTLAQQIITFIEQLLPTKYEGVIDISDQYGDFYTYNCGNVSLLDIARRFEGRKVRIEVIS